jgi:hypothetical protein
VVCLLESCANLCSSGVLRSLNSLLCDRKLDIRLSSRLWSCVDGDLVAIVGLRRPIRPAAAGPAFVSSAATCLYVVNALPATGRSVCFCRGREEMDGLDLETAGQRKRAGVVFGTRVAAERWWLDGRASCATLRLMLPHCWSREDDERSKLRAAADNAGADEEKVRAHARAPGRLPDAIGASAQNSAAPLKFWRRPGRNAQTLFRRHPEPRAAFHPHLAFDSTSKGCYRHRLHIFLLKFPI